MLVQRAADAGASHVAPKRPLRMRHLSVPPAHDAEVVDVNSDSSVIGFELAQRVQDLVQGVLGPGEFARPQMILAPR